MADTNIVADLYELLLLMQYPTCLIQCCASARAMCGSILWLFMRVCKSLRVLSIF